MPPKKIKRYSEETKQTCLQNITNCPTTKSSRKCVVRMQKIDMQESNQRKRKICDQDEGASQKSEEKTASPSPEYFFKIYDQLAKVISNKYIQVVDRLKLDYVPVCTENIVDCYTNHYRDDIPPQIPSTVQMNLVRSALQQSRYKTFLSLVWSFCHKNQFPGETVLTNIVNMLLTINPENKHNAYLQPILKQLLGLFDIILRKFPPCWLAIRPAYMNFLKTKIEISFHIPDKMLKGEIFEVILLLLEDTLDQASGSPNNRRARAKKEATTALIDLDDEYHNMQHWEKYDNDEQTFSALSKATKLDRLMQVLHLIAKILEMDLAMWMLRYHKKPSKYIYNQKDQPLIITLFSLTKYYRSSMLVNKVMTLFAQCVEQDLNEEYINVMGRFISLLANVQSLGELESSPVGIKYPYFGPATTSFTMDLFKTIEVLMKNNINAHKRLFRALRCPFVRYEYIDIFLKRLNPDSGRMCPQKIVENFGKNRWLECAPEEDRALYNTKGNKTAVVFRQDYLEILLEALKSYCDIHGLKEFLQSGQSNGVEHQEQPKTIIPTEIINDIKLSSLKKKISLIEKNADLSMILRNPKEESSVVNIIVDSNLYSQYRKDIKYVAILHEYIPALQKKHEEEDFSQFIEFLKDFGPKT